jgi:hypothetical protein
MEVPLLAAAGLGFVLYTLSRRTAQTEQSAEEASKTDSLHIGKRNPNGFDRWIPIDATLDDVSNYTFSSTVVPAGQTRDGNIRVDWYSRYGRAPGSFLM